MVRGTDTLAAGRWRHSRKRGQPRARSMLLTMLGEFVLPQREEPVWTRTFLAAFAALGVGEGAGRQALARSAAAGWLDAEKVGRESRWLLAPAMASTLAEGAERIYSLGVEPRPLGASWLLVQVRVPEIRRDAREQLRTRLAWLGFGSLGQGLWICAHVDREAALASLLDDLGLGDGAFEFRAQPASIEECRRVVDEAWQLDTLGEGYGRFLEDFRRPQVGSERAAFVTLARMVHRWRAFPFLDPQLPLELEPPAWPGRRAARRFHELRERWLPRARAWWRRQAG